MLVNFIAISYILCPFVIFCHHFNIIFILWYVVPRQIWQPWFVPSFFPLFQVSFLFVLAFGFCLAQDVDAANAFKDNIDSGDNVDNNDDNVENNNDNVDNNDDSNNVGVDTSHEFAVATNTSLMASGMVHDDVIEDVLESVDVTVAHDDVNADVLHSVDAPVDHDDVVGGVLHSVDATAVQGDVNGDVLESVDATVAHDDVNGDVLGSVNAALKYDDVIGNGKESENFVDDIPSDVTVQAAMPQAAVISPFQKLVKPVILRKVAMTSPFFIRCRFKFILFGFFAGQFRQFT
jgi:hypothetical protein